jgi:hypothetical protein
MFSDSKLCEIPKNADLMFYCGRSLKSHEMTLSDIATERFLLRRTWNMNFHLKLQPKVNFALNCCVIMCDLLFIKNHICCNVVSSFRALMGEVQTIWRGLWDIEDVGFIMIK